MSSSVGIRQPEFGQRLRRLRLAKGLSQRDVAGTVVNPSYISLLESGARVPTLEVVMQLAAALEVAPEDLAGITVPTGLPAQPRAGGRSRPSPRAGRAAGSCTRSWCARRGTSAPGTRRRPGTSAGTPRPWPPAAWPRCSSTASPCTTCSPCAATTTPGTRCWSTWCARPRSSASPS
ncbi:helix-turn-helix domain-containing protein [Actinokineospora soli]|uniref:Helix-turn-helix domain-containing protein n=1 Tax=Actinokineospora soli TaxID=1048753 RepID=A0ABW2TWW8_9PSEU